VIRRRPYWNRVVRLPYTFSEFYRLCRRHNAPRWVAFITAALLAWATVYQREQDVGLRVVSKDAAVEEVQRAVVNSVRKA
jgi:hypothetical protein